MCFADTRIGECERVLLCQSKELPEEDIFLLGKRQVAFSRTL